MTHQPHHNEDATLKPVAGEREAFEAAYRKLYPTTCGANPDKFSHTHGCYHDTTVMVAWALWQARANAVDHARSALRDVADAVCKQFSAAGIAAVIGSPNPAEDLHARAVLAIGGQVEREHIASAACWCEPTEEFRDPHTGAAVIVHRRMQ